MSTTPNPPRPASPSVRDFFPVDHEISGQEQGVDLFGLPVAPLRDRRGRPCYAKTPENQRLVTLLAGRGWSAEQIGPYMGTDPKTVRKHFSRELEFGAVFLEGQAMEVLVAKMREGNVRAALEVMAITRSLVAPVQKPKDKAPAATGKKDQAKTDAGRPPESWNELLN
jgi:hypothetical protein